MSSPKRHLLGAELIFSDGTTEIVPPMAFRLRRITGAPKPRLGVSDPAMLQAVRDRLPCVPLGCFSRLYAISLVYPGCRARGRLDRIGLALVNGEAIGRKDRRLIDFYGRMFTMDGEDFAVHRVRTFGASEAEWRHMQRKLSA